MAKEKDAKAKKGTEDALEVNRHLKRANPARERILLRRYTR